MVRSRPGAMAAIFSCSLGPTKSRASKLALAPGAMLCAGETWRIRKRGAPRPSATTWVAKAVRSASGGIHAAKK